MERNKEGRNKMECPIRLIASESIQTDILIYIYA